MIDNFKLREGSFEAVPNTQHSPQISLKLCCSQCSKLVQNFVPSVAANFAAREPQYLHCFSAVVRILQGPTFTTDTAVLQGCSLHTLWAIKIPATISN